MNSLPSEQDGGCTAATNRPVQDIEANSTEIQVAKRSSDTTTGQRFF